MEKKSKQRIAELAEMSTYVGGPATRIFPGDLNILDETDPVINQDIVRIILQYLRDNGYHAAHMALQDEALVRAAQVERSSAYLDQMKQHILEGEWEEAEKLVEKTLLKSNRTFLYSLYKEHYLDLLDKGDTQKAFKYLMKKLKPLEAMQTNPNEMKELSYLLTCGRSESAEDKTVHRQQLVEQFSSLLEFEYRRKKPDTSVEVPPKRLIHLLQQATVYQIEFSRYHPKAPPKIHTLLTDYSSFVMPNALWKTFSGHRTNIKCLCWGGEFGKQILSGSGNDIYIWDTESGELVQQLSGHQGRVWDVGCSRNGLMAVSCGSDGSAKIWDLEKEENTVTMKGHDGDVYSVSLHPAQGHIVSGGYDSTVRLWDVRGHLIKTLTGHTGSVSTTVFNHYGNLIISGSKDSTIRFWDITSGVPVQQFSSHLGEVTSVQVSKKGTLLLSSSKDNSNRLWDLRTTRPAQRFKGHQNTSKNFIRSCFGPDEQLVIGGSEDGKLYIWDIRTGNLLKRLSGHTGIAYCPRWNDRNSLLASCSDDHTVKLWWYDEREPLFDQK